MCDRASAWLVWALSLLAGCAGQSGPGLTLQPTPPTKPDVSKAPASVWTKIRTIAVLPLADAPKQEPEYVDSGNRQLGRVATRQYPVKDSGAFIQAKLLTAFVGTPYKVVERERLASLLDEQDLRLLFRDDKIGVKAGRLAGADAVVVGKVHELCYLSAWKKSAGGGFLKVDIPTVTFSIRLIDVVSGRTLWTCSASDTGRRFLREEYRVTVQAVLDDPYAAAVPLGSLDKLAMELAKESVRTIHPE